MDKTAYHTHHGRLLGQVKIKETTVFSLGGVWPFNTIASLCSWKYIGESLDSGESLSHAARVFHIYGKCTDRLPRKIIRLAFSTGKSNLKTHWHSVVSHRSKDASSGQAEPWNASAVTVWNFSSSIRHRTEFFRKWLNGRKNKGISYQSRTVIGGFFWSSFSAVIPASTRSTSCIFSHGSWLVVQQPVVPEI